MRKTLNERNDLNVADAKSLWPRSLLSRCENISLIRGHKHSHFSIGDLHVKGLLSFSHSINYCVLSSHGEWSSFDLISLTYCDVNSSIHRYESLIRIRNSNRRLIFSDSMDDCQVTNALSRVILAFPVVIANELRVRYSRLKWFAKECAFFLRILRRNVIFMSSPVTLWNGSTMVSDRPPVAQSHIFLPI